jgi:hypothetical protein
LHFNYSVLLPRKKEDTVKCVISMLYTGTAKIISRSEHAYKEDKTKETPWTERMICAKKMPLSQCGHGHGKKGKCFRTCFNHHF